MSSAIDIKIFRRKRKANLIKVLGGKCNLCGYDKIQEALEFHHIRPQEKEFGISNGNCRDLEKDLAEIKKCILVCANCHREIHQNIYSEDELLDKQFYDEEIANLLKENKKNMFEKTNYYCTSCGKILTQKTKTGLCNDCYKKTTRLCKRPSREELKQLIRTIPFTRIGEQFGVTDNAIRKWCEAEQLPKKKMEINSYSDEEWEKI